jgi:two-component system NtrC family sensor kinase
MRATRRLLVLSRMPIRKKFLCVTVLLTGTLLLLLFSSLRGVYAYRHLAQLLSQRARELQTISKLQEEVDNFRFSLRISDSIHPKYSFDQQLGTSRNNDLQILQLGVIMVRLADYEKHLKSHIAVDSQLADRSKEAALIKEIRGKVSLLLDKVHRKPGVAKVDETDLVELAQMTHRLPTYLQEWMLNFRDEERTRYRGWLAFIALSATATFLILGVAFWYFRIAVVQPFKVLLAGSRSIASGQFEHRITLQSHDELAELGDALNNMTTRFIEIRDNLNEKVQQRTREVVRSEQLASVGFLAAGVAHEINNPLASIAWSAEALEGRLHEILHVQVANPDGSLADISYDEQELNVLRKYLKRIQDEAFRCKGITERLLDFSRLSESQRKQETDVNESVSDMIALVQHLGQYRNKRVEYIGEEGLTAWVSPPELKQVVLNLLTNALDSVDDGGLVSVALEHDRTAFTLTVRDNGCGMTPEVLNHLFEPFFTRRRDGRGTGLGLSITYRIVQDHAGELVASSDGPGMGSKFILTLPLEKTNSQSHETIKAAA